MTSRTIEQLESRFCLSSHHGGDFHVEAMHYGMNDADGGAHVAPVMHVARGDHPFKPRRSFAPQQILQKVERHQALTGGEDDGGVTSGDTSAPAVGNHVNAVQHDAAVFVGVLVLPGNVVIPLFKVPTGQTNSNGVQAPAGTQADQVASNGTVQPPPDAQANVNVDVRPTGANASDARELLSGTDTTTAPGAGPVLATAAAPAATRSLASSAGSALDRLTSQWHDGIVAAFADVAQSSFAHLVNAEALVARAVDVATNLIAPVAEGGSSVTAAVTPAVAAVANVAAYDIAHMGSPFALLADSVAAFVEESSAVPNFIAAAQTNSRGPWALTAGVVAADVVVLTYVYRRKSTRRRAQLAMAGVE